MSDNEIVWRQSEVDRDHWNDQERQGAHKITTLGGGVMTAKMMSDKITRTDKSGSVAAVTIVDVKQSNGVVHVIDAVMLPKM
jgi:uncharacterized surface protein with fasciclin (FAS1) repeats